MTPFREKGRSAIKEVVTEIFTSNCFNQNLVYVCKTIKVKYGLTPARHWKVQGRKLTYIRQKL